MVNLTKLNQEAMEQIEHRYGDTGETPLAYHNQHHTKRVRELCVSAAQVIGLNQIETHLLDFAAASHDLYQLTSDNEGLSAEWAKNKLVSAGVAPVLQNFVELSIIGTTCDFENGTIKQRVNRQEYPNKRCESFSQALAAADVGVIFMPEGPLWSHRLLSEQNPQPTQEEMIRFQNGQIDFLLNYTFPTRELEKLYATNKAAVMRHVTSLLAGLENGSITSIGELVRRDKQLQSDNA